RQQLLIPGAATISHRRPTRIRTVYRINSSWILPASQPDTDYGHLVGSEPAPRMCHQEEPHVKARKTRLLAILATLALVAAACGGGDTEGSGDTNAGGEGAAEGKLAELQEAGTVTVGIANE